MALHCGVFSFRSVTSHPPSSVKFSQPTCKASAFSSPLAPPIVKLNVRGNPNYGSSLSLSFMHAMFSVLFEPLQWFRICLLQLGEGAVCAINLSWEHVSF